MSQVVLGDVGNGSGLRTGSVNMLGTLGLSLGSMAPTAAVSIVPAVMAADMGESGPFGFALGIIVGLFVAYAFILFTRRFSSAGAVYAFNRIALGVSYGFVSVWIFMFAYLTFVGATAAQTSDFIQVLGAPAWLHWGIIAVAAILVAGALSYRSIAISAFVAAAVELVGIVFVIIVGIVVIAHGGYHGDRLSLSYFTPNGLPLASVALGVVFAFTGLTGFEAAATLGEESRNPRRAIPLAVIVALVGAGVMLTFGDWIETMGFPSATALAASATPLYTITQRYLGNGIAPIVDVLAIISAFGALLAYMNGAARLLFALGRDGFIHHKIAWTHPKYRTPAVGIGIAIVAGILTILPIMFHGTATDGFFFPVTAGALGDLAMYFMTIIGAIYFFTRRERGFGHAAVLVIGLIMIAYVLYSSLVPIPAFPYNIDAYVFWGWLVLGIVVIAVDHKLRARLNNASVFEVGGVEALDQKQTSSV